ncbi:MAG TPA: MarC family NAAT transporter [Saprospiraceae bacterium]|nr:MarC family NAAT transporter [Saprospiraceae bacterium]
MELFVTFLAALFSVVNPFGAIPVFLALTPDYTPSERNQTALFTSIYFILLLLAFFFAGTYILGFFGLQVDAMRIAGGVVIVSSGFALLNGKFAESRAINKKVEEEAIAKEDISFSPLAMPLLSGPGSISLLISTYSDYPEWTDKGLIGLVIITTGIIIYFTLRISPLLFKILGVGGLKAISRIMGFIVMSIGIQYIILGIVNLVQNFYPLSAS